MNHLKFDNERWKIPEESNLRSLIALGYPVYVTLILGLTLVLYYSMGE